MKIKKIKKIQIGDTEFQIKWDKKESGGEFSYPWGKEKKKPFIRISIIDEKVNPIIL